MILYCWLNWDFSYMAYPTCFAVREAEPAGWKSRAGRTMAAGPAGQSSRPSRLVAREAGPAGRKLQHTSLVLTCFPRLSQSQRILLVCPHFIIYLVFLWSILYPVLSSNWVLVSYPLCRQEGMGVGASLEVLWTYF